MLLVRWLANAILPFKEEEEPGASDGGSRLQVRAQVLGRSASEDLELESAGLDSARVDHVEEALSSYPIQLKDVVTWFESPGDLMLTLKEGMLALADEDLATDQCWALCRRAQRSDDRVVELLYNWHHESRHSWWGTLTTCIHQRDVQLVIFSKKVRKIVWKNFSLINLLLSMIDRGSTGSVRLVNLLDFNMKIVDAMSGKLNQE